MKIKLFTDLLMNIINVKYTNNYNSLILICFIFLLLPV
ncbi:hypothetical protein yfred0001_39840 [Yersinia frederiksenii ATCC 33641]|nr:hypothetical protein yfred0001_39840 [Yersinia frederiksenii ATCC 33641]